VRSLFYCAAVLILSVGLLSGATTIAVQSGGIVVTSFDTTTPIGSEPDPWLLSEDMTGTGTLIFRATDPEEAVGPGNQAGTTHATGRWIQKSVTNFSGVAWTSFEIELQEALGTPSGDGDGLSFAQDAGLLFSSDLFASYTRLDVTRDYLNFSNGVVNPGETVTFSFVITDNSPTSPIYLLQTPNREDVPRIPEPSTALLLGGGLTAVYAFRRRFIRS
jgi:hypothetical protein